MTNEPRGCLSFLFGSGGGSHPTSDGVDPIAVEEGNNYAGPGGYEGGSCSGVMPPSIAASKNILMRATSANHT